MTLLLNSWLRLITVLGALVIAKLGAAHELILHQERDSKFDLGVAGLVTGIEAGQTRYIRWHELRGLPTETLTLNGEFVSGDQKVTVVFLSELLKRLPLAAGADAVVATCKDGYVSVYTMTVVGAYRPFVVLEINGDGPEKWPPAGLSFNPGPYVISVSPALAPDQPPLLDSGHKRPWGVATLELVNYTERFKNAFTGNWSHLSSRAQVGREIWINSCTSCHPGPGGMFGGSKAERPFEVLAAHAAFNTVYFKRYVRDPQGAMPGAKMEPHPHYTDTQLDALIAFIGAESTEK